MRVILILTATCLVTSATHAGERVEAVKAAAPDAAVRIDCPRGDVDIIGWERAEVSIDGELDDLADRLIFEADARGVLVKVKLPTGKPNFGDGSDLTIRVPATAAVHVRAASTDVDVQGLQALANIHTLSGDVRGRGLGNMTRINTANGDVDVEEASGRLSITTISGSIEAEAAAREITVDTVSGSVELELEAFTKLLASSKTSDIAIRGQLLPNGLLDASTVNGGIELRLRTPINADISARAGIGGDIDNELTDERPNNSPGRRDLRLRLGDGSAGVHLITVNGEITLEADD